MEGHVYELKIKIFYQNTEILKIKTPSSYSELRSTLSNNQKCPISNFIILKYMDDFGNYKIINNEDCFKEFLGSSNGLCHYIEIFDESLKLLIEQEKDWECSHCFNLNSHTTKICICETLKKP